MKQAAITPFRRISNEMKFRSKKAQRAFANDFSALNPTIWANEAVYQLIPNLLYGGIVTRDFDTQVAKFGDVVNAYVPSTFVTSRKGAVCEALTTQDASGSSIQIALDQYFYVSFIICDGEENRTQLDLIDSLLTPAVITIAKDIDLILAGQAPRFLANVTGHLQGGTTSTILPYILEAREKMNVTGVPSNNRFLALTPSTETLALQVEAFTNAQWVNDQGRAMQQAYLGDRFGFHTFSSPRQPQVTFGAGATIGTSGGVAINNASGYQPGTTTIAVDGTGAGSSAVNVLVGMWLTIAGDDVPHRVTGNTTGTLTLDTPLVHSVVDNAVILILQGGLVNNASGYIGTSTTPRVIGWNKEIATDTWIAGSGPSIGQFLTFGSDATKYVITNVRAISSTAYGIVLDRPLAIAITDNTVINPGPVGRYNLAFDPNALILVNRPLPTPRPGLGVISKVISDPISKISMRVTLTYDGSIQGTRCTVDTLMGVGVLNQGMGVPLLA